MTDTLFTVFRGIYSKIYSKSEAMNDLVHRHEKVSYKNCLLQNHQCSELFDSFFRLDDHSRH